MKDYFIILKNPNEVIKDRLGDIIGEAEGIFFSNQNEGRVLFPVSDEFYKLLDKNIQRIRKRLNSQLNLFNIYFDVSIVRGRHEDYIEIEVRRAT